MPLPPGYQWTQDPTNYGPMSGIRVPSREQIETDREEYRASDELFKNWDWQNPEGLGAQGEALPEFAIGWKPNGEADFGTGLTGWWKKAYSNVRAAWKTGYEEGLRITGAKERSILREQGEAQGAATLEKMKAERKPETENQAYWTAAAEATKEVFDQALWGVLDGLGAVAVGAEQVIGTAGYTLADVIDPNRPVNEKTFRENWNASRLAYSGIFDATIFEEMNRRIDSGVRPDLATQEIMIEKPWTMWPELIGQIVYDPLNLISVWTKAADAKRIEKSVRATFETVTNPTLAKLVDNVDEIAKMDEAKAYRYIKELATSQQGLTAAAEHAEDIATSAGKMEELSMSFKLGSLTRDGKIAHLANQTGEIMMHVVNNAGDEAPEIFRGMVLSASKDPAQAAEGVSIMLRFPDVKALLSEAGNNTTVMLSRMVAKYGDNWLENIAKLKNDPTALTKDLLTKLDKVGNELFPSVSDMLKAEDDIRKGVQFGSDAAKLKAEKLAERAKDLPEYVRAATRFHDTAQKFVGPANKFFIGAYMGWSPGYAFRNFSNNSLQMLVDYGPGILLGSADNMFSKAEKLHGGVLQGAHGFGAEAAALFPKKKLAGETGLKAIIQAAKEKGLKGPALGLAEKLEANAAKRIIAKSYTKTFEQGTKAMTKALAPDLKAAGFSDDIINKLPTYIMQNDGDAGRVIAALRADVQSGVIDLFNDIDRIDPKYKAFLSDVGKWDEYAETVLRAPTREAAQTAAQKIFDDLTQAGDFAYSDGRAAATVDDQFLKMAEKEGGLPEQRGQLISIRESTNLKAIEAAEEILKEADSLAARIGLDPGALKRAHNINEITGWSAEAHKEKTRIRNIALKLYKKDARVRGVDFEQLWSAYPEIFPDAPPGILNYDRFVDSLWMRYDRVVGRMFGAARDTAVDGVKAYLDDIKKALPQGQEINPDWYDILKEAQDGAAQYDNVMIGRNGWLVEEAPMEYGARSSQIAAIAKKYGVETATEAGLATDKRTLATINKYAGVKYTSLEDVPIQVAEDAFAKKAGKATGINSELADFLKTKDLPVEEVPVNWQAMSDAELKKYPITQAILEYKTKLIKEQAELNTKLWSGLPKEELAPIQKRLGEVDELLFPTDAAHFDDAGDLKVPAGRVLPPPVDGEAPTISRAIFDQMEDVKKMRSWIMDDITQNFGKKQLVDKVAESGLKKAERELTQKLAETRLISSRVAQANRDFTLLNYGEKSYWDTALAYLYPFHFWYKGTYRNWLKRIAQNPAVLAHYARYKDILGTVHAGMPEWWKYNINTNDLPGVDVENPLYFNLEATLWPLNGLTNTDFNDPSKRVNWWTYSLDFANKFGPSTWSPINMMTGLMLYKQGEREAGERWMGRLIPQSATIKAGASLLGIANAEYDPFVSLLQGGLDPYERRRVGRALAEMEQEAIDGTLPYSREQIQDAAYSQEGEVWDEAVKRAVRGRAPSQLSSFMFGVGFKGRTEQDVQVDKFYGDYNKLWQMRPNITPEEFREGMDTLKEKYPFMDTVLLSRRTGVERDAGLAYNILSRIPPGKSSDIAKAAGIDPALFDKFFADKGQIDRWAPADRQKFMSGILNISAVLEIPPDMTRREWTAARNAYSQMSNDAKRRFGPDILDMVDGYYAAKTKSYDAANAYLDRYPEVSDYMNWKAERVMGSPLLSAYYGGASMIEGYYKSQMYEDIEKKIGPDIFDVIDEYNDLKTFGEGNEYKRFYAQNKAKIKQYYKMKDAWAIIINQNVARLSAHLPESEGEGIREDYDTTSPGARGLAGSLEGPGGERMALEDFRSVIPERLMNLTLDYFYEGKRLPESAERQLSRLAQELGYYDTDELLQAIGTSLYAQ